MATAFDRRKIRPGMRLHPFFSDLCVLMDAVYIAGEVVLQLPITRPFQKHSFSLACARLPVDVIIPILGPFYAAVLNDPRPVTYEIATIKAQPTDQHITTPQLRTANHIIFSALFVTFYERYRPWLQGKFGREVKNWPELFRFIWAIRNACAHHEGRVNFTNPTSAPVSWSGVTISPADNGKALLGNDIAMGDLVILVVELSDSLDELGCPA